MILRFFLLPLAGLFITTRLPADIEADAVVKKMIERDRRLAADRAMYTFTAIETREKLDADGKTTSSEMTRTDIRGDQSAVSAHPSGQGMEDSLKQASREEPFNTLKIIWHYEFHRLPDETWNGVPCYRIHFVPKDNQAYGSREEKVANALEGDLWIARSDFSLLHQVGHLTQPVAVAWFFASVYDLDFDYQTKLLPNGEFGPDRVQYRFRVKVPFTQIHERHTRVTTDYRLTP